MEEKKEKIVIANYYASLGDDKKKEIRDAFMREFDYSLDAFYKKIRANRFRPIEYKWLAKRINVKLEDINQEKL